MAEVSTELAVAMSTVARERGPGYGRGCDDGCELAASVAQQRRELTGRGRHRLRSYRGAELTEEGRDGTVTRVGRVGEPCEELVDPLISIRSAHHWVPCSK
jgi:hypothetical protein